MGTKKTDLHRLYDAIDETNVWSAADVIPIVAEIFDGIVNTLKRDPRFAALTRNELDLLLAGVRVHAEQDLGELLDDKIDVADAVHNIADLLTDDAPYSPAVWPQAKTNTEHQA